MKGYHIFIIFIFLLIIGFSFSGRVLEKTITINADNYSKSVIQHVLDISDKNITKYIDSVTVYEDAQHLNNKCKSIKSTIRMLNETYIEDYAGCADIIYDSDSDNSNIKSTNMYILSDNNLKEYCNSEANTLAYLIGVTEYRKKYITTLDGYYVNLYGNEYANKIIKDKCSTDEYINLYNNFNTLQNNYNITINKYNQAVDTYNLAVDKYNTKWDYYFSKPIEKVETIKPKEKIGSQNCITLSNSQVICTETILPMATYVIARICNTYTSQYCDEIPENRYYEYTKDYELYHNSYNEYSEAYNEYSDTFNEYSNSYDEISNKMNESINNYKYPFEVITK